MFIKCPTCHGSGAGIGGRCPKCHGKRYFETEQPQAIGGTDDARRSSRSDEGRSPVVDGAAPLCDGPEELKRAAAVIQREVQRRMAKLWMPGCFKEIARLRILDAALVELLPDDYAETAGGPAQSAKLSEPEEAK